VFDLREKLDRTWTVEPVSEFGSVEGVQGGWKVDVHMSPEKPE
jgi:hypothetical protein